MKIIMSNPGSLIVEKRHARARALTDIRKRPAVTIFVVEDVVEKTFDLKSIYAPSHTQRSNDPSDIHEHRVAEADSFESIAIRPLKLNDGWQDRVAIYSRATSV